MLKKKKQTRWDAQLFLDFDEENLSKVTVMTRCIWSTCCLTGERSLQPMCRQQLKSVLCEYLQRLLLLPSLCFVCPTHLSLPALPIATWDYVCIFSYFLSLSLPWLSFSLPVTLYSTRESLDRCWKEERTEKDNSKNLTIIIQFFFPYHKGTCGKKARRISDSEAKKGDKTNVIYEIKQLNVTKNHEPSSAQIEVPWKLVEGADIWEIRMSSWKKTGGGGGVWSSESAAREVCPAGV